MGLFGSKQQKTVTTVKPAPEVESILRRVVQQTENEDLGDYIASQFAKYTPEERAIIQQRADSGDLRMASGALSPRMMQGLNQMADVNKQLGDIANNGITANEILANKGTLQKGLYSNVQRTAQAGGNLPKTDAARAAARRGGNQMQARAALDPSLTNQSIGLAQNKRQNQVDYTQMQSGIANSNVGLGMEGLDLGNQATQNQLQTGDFLQQYQNAMNNNEWQNANSAALWPWEKLNNKLAILDQVSPMAGSTTVTKGPGASRGAQLASAGLMGLSLYGSTGGFANADSKTQTGWQGTGDNPIPQYKMNNQWNNSAGTGIFNRVGSTFGNWMGS